MDRLAGWQQVDCNFAGGISALMPRVLQYIVHVDTIEVVGLTGLEKICWIWRSKVVFPFPDGP